MLFRTLLKKKKQGPRPCLLMRLKLVVLAVVFYGNYLA